MAGGGGGSIAELFLLGKNEEPSLTPSIHMKKPDVVVDARHRTLGEAWDRRLPVTHLQLAQPNWSASGEKGKPYIKN